MDKDSTKKCDREGQQGMGTRGTEVWGGRPQGSASSMHSSSCTAWDHSRTSHHCPLIPKLERERHTTTQAAKLNSWLPHSFSSPFQLLHQDMEPCTPARSPLSMQLRLLHASKGSSLSSPPLAEAHQRVQIRPYENNKKQSTPLTCFSLAAGGGEEEKSSAAAERKQTDAPAMQPIGPMENQLLQDSSSEVRGSLRSWRSGSP